MAERRGTVRAVARIEVFDEKTHVDRVPLFVSGNVSAGGIFLITQEPYKSGTKMRIRFNLPDDPNVIETEGEVVWQRPKREGSQRQPGMGVQFTKIEGHDRERIREFVSQQVEAGNIDPEE
jgi:uncharacterized protein (TIGR02266 family)